MNWRQRTEEGGQSMGPRRVDTSLLDEYARLLNDPRIDPRAAYRQLGKELDEDVYPRLGLIEGHSLMARDALYAHASRVVDAERERRSGVGGALRQAREDQNALLRELHEVRYALKSAGEVEDRARLLDRMRGIYRDLKTIAGERESAEESLISSVQHLDEQIAELEPVWRAVKRLETVPLRVSAEAAWSSLTTGAIRLAVPAASLVVTWLVDSLTPLIEYLGSLLTGSGSHSTAVLLFFALQFVLLSPLGDKASEKLYRHLGARRLQHARSIIQLLEAAEAAATVASALVQEAVPRLEQS